MSLFDYNSPTISFLTKAANVLIVSLYWLVCCLPLVTILPACAALYYATTHVVFQTKSGVTKAFFTAFRDACRPGILLSVIADVLAVLIYLGIITGLQTWKEGLFWAFYLTVGLLIAFLLLSALICIGPVLSRFQGGATVILRLALYFSGKNIFRSILNVLLLTIVAWMVDFFPLLILVLPVVYTDLIHGKLDKYMDEFITASGLEEPHGTTANKD